MIFGPKTELKTEIHTCAKQPVKKPLFIPNTKASHVWEKQPKKQLKNGSKIQKKIPHIKISSIHTF